MGSQHVLVCVADRFDRFPEEFVHLLRCTPDERARIEQRVDIHVGKRFVPLQTLQQIGYEGPLTIEREIPQEPERQKAEIGKAVDLLQRLKQQMGVVA